MKFKVGDYAIFNKRTHKQFYNEGILRIITVRQHYDQYFVTIHMYKEKRDSFVYFEEDDLIKVNPPTRLLKILLDIEEE